jgi:hypothetical protein
MKYRLINKFAGISEISLSWMADYSKHHFSKMNCGGPNGTSLVYVWFIGHLQFTIGRKIRKQFYIPISE